jgi:hypothetical protein
MTQKPSTEKLESALLQSIDPKEIADQSMRQTVEILLNLIEQLHSQVEDLEQENQKLRDEINRLKGEQGQPEIKGKKPRGFSNNYSSEKERKTPKKHDKGRKKENINIDREEILECEPEKLPPDAEFKGYEEVIVQDLKLSTDNILFRKQKYYSPSEKKTYLAQLPAGYSGEFGPGVKSLVISLYYGGNMTQGKLLELLEDLGISLSAGHLSHLLIQNHACFEAEKEEICSAGLASSPWQHLDQTSARVGGVNYTTNIICNPVYTVYTTTAHKDRLSVLKALQNGRELEFLLQPVTYELLSQFEVAQKWQDALQKLPQTVFFQSEFQRELEQHLPNLGSRVRSRILEAAAIACYQQSTEWPVVQTLVCDDAPQFKLLTDNLSLCWVHEGRHYKKLQPLVAYHQQLLEQFQDDFWDYYRQLLAYKEAPSAAMAEILLCEFEQLFGTESGYQQLDERKRLTKAKIAELLLVLDHPELPLHNNPAELGARTMVLRRNISYGTQTTQGTEAWDTFMSLVATTRKLGISFFEYIRDRIGETETIPSVAALIRELSASNPFGWSWQPES